MIVAIQAVGLHDHIPLLGSRRQGHGGGWQPLLGLPALFQGEADRIGVRHPATERFLDGGLEFVGAIAFQ